MSNPYKEGSRKAEIYDVFTQAGGGDKGLKAAFKRAAKVGIKDGTVKSWSSMWLKGETKPTPKEGGDAKPKPKAKASAEFHDKGYSPHFKYTSREQANKAHEKLCERAAARPHAFHVIEDEGRFAVAPANYKPGGPMPIFKVGDIVYDALIINSKAKVINAGPEQSVVRYAKDRPSRPREDCVINRFLVKLPDDEVPNNKRLQKAIDDSGAMKMKAVKKERARL